MRVTKVLIVENHAIVRQALRALLSQVEGLKVIAEAVDGRDALRFVRTAQPDIVLMDIRMPNLNGVDACRQILKECPTTHVIALTLLADQNSVKTMFDAGAKGYLLKDSGLGQLTDAIHAVMHGKKYLTPELSGRIDEHHEEPAGMGKHSKQLLSGREREVLQLVSEGRTTRQIAEELSISVKTVETHRHNLMQKTGLYSIADLTKFAIRSGLTEVGFGGRQNRSV